MPEVVKRCSIEGCGRAVVARGICRTHYARQRRGVDLEVPVGGLYAARGPYLCSIEGCGRRRHGGGLCTTHRYRQLAGADMHAPVQPYGLDLATQLDRHVWRGTADDCWPSRSLQRDGYGTFEVAGKQWLAHRAAWVVTHGRSIPAVMQVHHVCRNRACANPAHLELMTAEAHTKLHSQHSH